MFSHLFLNCISFEHRALIGGVYVAATDKLSAVFDF